MVTKIGVMTIANAIGRKLIESDTHIGLFNSSLNHSIVISKHPLSKTRLLLIKVGKLTIKLFNFKPMFSFHKSEYIYGIHLLFLRLTWNRF